MSRCCRCGQRRSLILKRRWETQQCYSSPNILLNNTTHSHRSRVQVTVRTWPFSLFPPSQYLDCLWAQMQKLKKDRWQERHILRPYIAFDSVLCEALQHNLPPFTPPGHMPDAEYPMPQVVFRMFDYTDAPEVQLTLLVTFLFPINMIIMSQFPHVPALCLQGPVMPGSHSVERFVIEENLHCIIKTHWKERKTWWVTSLIVFCKPTTDTHILTLLIFFYNLSVLLSYSVIQGKTRFRSTITLWRYKAFVFWQTSHWAI